MLLSLIFSVLCSLSCTSVPLKSQALSHLSWQAESKQESQAFVHIKYICFRSQDSAGVLLPVLNFINLVFQRTWYRARMQVTENKTKQKFQKTLATWLQLFYLFFNSVPLAIFFSYTLFLLFFSLKGRWKPSDYSLYLYIAAVCIYKARVSLWTEETFHLFPTTWH